jgi:hypothetical protein
MACELYLSGFLLTREDWDLVDADTRSIFTKMLAEEGRRPTFDDGERVQRQFVQLNGLA